MMPTRGDSVCFPAGNAPRMRQRSTARVVIRALTAEDRPEFLAAVRRSRSLHHSWVSPPTTAKAFARYVEHAASEAHRKYLVIHRETGEFVGVINLNNVIRGAFQNAFLGYYGFLPYAGHGLMCEWMRLVLQQAFGKLKLHRVEANIQPANEASIALVRRCGFVREGVSRRFLKIFGCWRDHERWALLAEDFAEARKAAREL